jgi:hypothetical protein
VRVDWVEGSENTADIFTKPLARPTFEKHRDKLVSPVPPQEAKRPGGILMFIGDTEGRIRRTRVKFNGVRLPFWYDSACYPLSIIPAMFLHLIDAVDDTVELARPDIYKTYGNQEIRIRRIVNIRVSLQDREERGEPDNFVEDEFGVMEDENLGFVLVSDTTLSKFGMDTMDSMVLKYLKSLREPGEGHRSNEVVGGASRHRHVTTANILESANRRNHKMSQELSKAVTQGANGIEVLGGILDELEVSARGTLEAGAPQIAGTIFSMRLKLKALQSMLEDRNESMARTLVLNERAAFAEECQRQNEIAEQGSLGQLRAQIRSAIQAEEETEAMAMAVRLINPGGPVSLSQRFSNLQDVVVPDQGTYDGDDDRTVSMRDGMEPRPDDPVLQRQLLHQAVQPPDRYSVALRGCGGHV